ncbi:hypothetical protein AJ80_05623 [Polytolypa hystricis UAMH7299]|uniref:Uncharacterized protein n=1 Tax=Polytolypa hystricis (strain UAMH7299) TaxID=1447883 RepID=A0A2B7Y1W1_POLH7|nr:hypothetical protein AJ80_05623 [Polytolypa hystricis UAMH7299]
MSSPPGPNHSDPDSHASSGRRPGQQPPSNSSQAHSLGTLWPVISTFLEPQMQCYQPQWWPTQQLFPTNSAPGVAGQVAGPSMDIIYAQPATSITLENRTDPGSRSLHINPQAHSNTALPRPHTSLFPFTNTIHIPIHQSPTTPPTQAPVPPQAQTTPPNPLPPSSLPLTRHEQSLHTSLLSALVAEQSATSATSRTNARNRVLELQSRISRELHAQHEREYAGLGVSPPPVISIEDYYVIPANEEGEEEEGDGARNDGQLPGRQVQAQAPGRMSSPEHTYDERCAICDSRPVVIQRPHIAGGARLCQECFGEILMAEVIGSSNYYSTSNYDF